MRPALIARLGRGGFATIHSVGSLVTLALFVLAYRAADGGEVVFTPFDWAAPLVAVVMPIVFLLLVARVTTRFAREVPDGALIGDRFTGPAAVKLRTSQ